MSRLHLVKSLHPEFLRLSPQEHRKLVEQLQPKPSIDWFSCVWVGVTMTIVISILVYQVSA